MLQKDFCIYFADHHIYSKICATLEAIWLSYFEFYMLQVNIFYISFERRNTYSSRTLIQFIQSGVYLRFLAI